MSATSTCVIAEYVPSAARRHIVARVNCIDCAGKSYIYTHTHKRRYKNMNDG